MAAPPTDAGTVPNLKFPYAMAHNRVTDGGWAREITIRELPIATELAGHARVTAIDPEGQNFVDDVGPGDLWNFPPGIPHSIQALEDGCEFLLVFDDGHFWPSSRPTWASIGGRSPTRPGRSRSSSSEARRAPLRGGLNALADVL